MRSSDYEADLSRASACGKQRLRILFDQGTALSNLKNFDLIAFNDDAAELAGRIGTGINIDPVGPHVDRTYRSMAVYDDFGELALVEKKIIADP